MKAERVGQVLIAAGFTLGTIYGWFTQSLLFALYGWVGGLALALILCVPPWPFFRLHPIKWLPLAQEEEEEEEESEESEEEVIKSKSSAKLGSSRQ